MGRNSIILYDHYSLDIKFGKRVCDIFHITYVFKACVDQLGNNCFPKCAPISQRRYARVENVTITRYLKVTMIGFLWN